MTDIIGTLAKAVSDWNDENKCDLCWEFTAPMRESDLNEYKQKSDCCCVIVAVTDYRWACNQTTNVSTGYVTQKAETFNFNLHFLAKDDLGLNVYNEINGHPLSESKWSTILMPLMDCVGCNPIDFCTYLGLPLEVLNWSATSRIDWLDMNYTGWTISVSLRLNNTY